MAARLTYSGTPFYDQIMKEGFKAGKPTGGFSTRLADYFQSGPKTFSSPNKGVASLYGRTIPMVSSASNLRLPSGGIPGKTLGEALRNLTGTRVGTEVIQTPKQANKGMDIARKALDRANRGVSSTASRLLGGQTVSGIGASQAGKNVLGRVLGAALGPAATYASALAAPNMYMASMLDGPNVRSGAADQFAGMMGEAMIPEDYPAYSELLGMPEASQALDDEYYDFDKETNPYSELDDFEAQNAGSFIPEEEKGIFSLGDILADLGRKGVEGFKDVAGRSIASQALSGAGGMILGPMGALAGGILGLTKGGDMFNSPYIGAGAATMDEYGNMYSAEQLDKKNARGGYYTDPARASRRRDKGIINMIERRNKGLDYGKDRLAKELAKQAEETAARQSAADAMQDSNRANRTGGYQSSMRDDTGFMEGPDTSKGESFSSVQGST